MAVYCIVWTGPFASKLAPTLIMQSPVGAGLLAKTPVQPTQNPRIALPFIPHQKSQVASMNQVQKAQS